MTSKQPLNRKFYEGPDPETLNILIELGEIVKHSDPIVLEHVPTDVEGTRGSLLRAAATTILTIKGLRSAAKRLQEPAEHIPYDFRLPVFPPEPNVDPTIYTDIFGPKS